MTIKIHSTKKAQKTSMQNSILPLKIINIDVPETPHKKLKRKEAFQTHPGRPEPSLYQIKTRTISGYHRLFSMKTDEKFINKTISYTTHWKDYPLWRRRRSLECEDDSVYANHSM